LRFKYIKIRILSGYDQNTGIINPAIATRVIPENTIDNIRKTSYSLYDDINDINMDKIYYKLFNYNNEDDAILINGKIPIIINPPKKLNDFFKRDLYLDSKSSIELGIVDGIYN
jgi:hypothetical protein